MVANRRQRCACVVLWGLAGIVVAVHSAMHFTTLGVSTSSNRSTSMSLRHAGSRFITASLRQRGSRHALHAKDGGDQNTASSASSFGVGNIVGTLVAATGATVAAVVHMPSVAIATMIGAPVLAAATSFGLTTAANVPSRWQKTNKQKANERREDLGNAWQKFMAAPTPDSAAPAYASSYPAKSSSLAAVTPQIHAARPQAPGVLPQVESVALERSGERAVALKLTGERARVFDSALVQTSHSLGRFAGGPTGLLVGVGAGGVSGLLMAPMTFGLSVPQGMKAGAEFGFKAGTDIGGNAGAAVGHAANEMLIAFTNILDMNLQGSMSHATPHASRHDAHEKYVV